MTSARSASLLLRLTLATLLLHLVLIQPNHPAAMTWYALVVFPLELPVVILALLALPSVGLSTTLVRAALTIALVTLVTSKLADLASFIAYGRAFNPIVDADLVHAAWVFLAGNLGGVSAGFIVLVLLGALALLAALIWWATAQWSRLLPPPPARVGLAVLGAMAAVVMVGEIGQAMRYWTLPVSPPGAAFTARVAYERGVQYRQTLADLAHFQRAARNDPFAQVRPGSLLRHAADRDVLIAFIESYGRSSLSNPLYAKTHVPTLRMIGQRLRDRGLAIRSAFLSAPTAGGQSWLSHATLASGLWTDSQGRYRALLASPRRTLFHHARIGGFHTAAVMPAITMDWPEAGFFGFDTILAAADLGYAGEPYNWVTMPDQYTLSAMDRLLLDGRPGQDRPPVFAQIALISSHAPWIPIPPLLEWESIGDGRIFNRWVNDGDPPARVWQDRDRVRDQFRLAIDYSLRVVGAYAERHAEQPPLMIVLGDHEPTGFVSQTGGFDVPVHVIGPPEVIARIDAWGWSDGMAPGDDAPVWSMDQFRDRFLHAFSDPP